MQTSADLRNLVLVGAGHAHVQVLRHLIMKPFRGCRVTLVVDRPVAVYSGMVPGVVSGEYRAHEVEIDALPLARRAGARVVIAPFTSVDTSAKRIHVEGRAPIAYDVASFNVGSTVRGLELPGAREHAIATRPIARFVGSIEGLVVEAAAVSADRAFEVVVVGAGAGGVELAACIQARITGSGARVNVTLIDGAGRTLAAYPASLSARVEGSLARRGIAMLMNTRVAALDEGAVRCGDGRVLPADAVFWATGAAPHPALASANLPVDERGFLRTRGTLQLEGHDDLFAAGDTASLVDHPETAKAGVYAVRAGPYLIDNLQAALEGRALKRYVPQRDFLTLLNLGDGTAIGAKRGFSFEGRWVMRWKDRIDRRFMRMFQLLEPDGSAGPAASMLATKMSAMPGAEMVCGGCAAKLGQEPLERALSRLPPAPEAPEVLLGVAEADDVSAVRLAGGSVLVSSVDFFRAFTDDPYLVGRIAAENALSDIDAKGAVPRWAQALVALPIDAGDRDNEETLYQALAGARGVFDARGVRLIGGHTSKAADLQVGFAVQGESAANAALARRRGEVAPGQWLLLTRPLGTGVILHADMAGRARGPWLELTLASMVQGNAAAMTVAGTARAATDITGFGLAGHLASMLTGSGCAARISLAALPALPGAVKLFSRGEKSTFHDENAKAVRAMAIDPVLVRDPRLQLLFDPQTAGGLLLALDPEAVPEALASLRAAGYAEAAVIGDLTSARDDGAFAAVLP